MYGEIILNLPLILFHAAVANSNTGSRNYLHTLFDTYLDHVIAKFKPNRLIRALLLKNDGFFFVCFVLFFFLTCFTRR